MNNPLPVSDLNDHIGPVMRELKNMGWTASPGWITAHCKIAGSVYGINATTIKDDPDGPITSIRWEDSGSAGTLFTDTGEMLAKDIAPAIVNKLHRNIIEGTMGIIEDPQLKALYAAMMPSMDVINTASHQSLTEPYALKTVKSVMDDARQQVMAYEIGLENPVTVVEGDTFHDHRTQLDTMCAKHGIHGSTSIALWLGMIDKESQSWPDERKDSMSGGHIKETMIQQYLITKGAYPYDFTANEILISVQGNIHAFPMPAREENQPIRQIADDLFHKIPVISSRPSVDAQHFSSKIAAIAAELEAPSANDQGPRL